MIDRRHPWHCRGFSRVSCLATQNLSSCGYTPSFGVKDAFMYARVILSMASTNGASMAAVLAFFSSGITWRAVCSAKKEAAVFLGFHFFLGSSGLNQSSVTEE